VAKAFSAASDAPNSRSVGQTFTQHRQFVGDRHGLPHPRRRHDSPSSIFQMSAEAFSNLSPQARADVIESAMTRTYRAGVHIHPDHVTGGAVCALQAAVAMPDL
jgi:hypothetical protein